MARFLLIALLTTTAVLSIQARQFSHAGPSSTAEEFWRTVLPDSPLPESIRWLLHPESTGGEIVSTGTAGDDDGGDDDESLSQPFPYFYFGYKGSSSPTPAGDNDEEDVAESLSQPDYPYFYFGYKKPSAPTTPPADGAQLHQPQQAATNGTVVFFHEEAVRVGETLPIYFPPAARGPRGLLPRDVADSVQFATSALPDILARFGINAGSVEARKTERTLRMCEAPSLQGEAKFCASSLEAMVEGAMAALRTRDVTPVTSALPRAGAPLQPYTVRAVRRVLGGSRFVACHQAHHPFTVFMCHDTGRVRAYMVDMEGGGESGSKVTVTVVCHTDTSKWDPEHMSFKLLGTKPGVSTVCHFMPYGHIMWAKKNAVAAAASSSV